MRTHLFIPTFIVLSFFINSMNAQTPIVKLWPDKIPGVISNSTYQENSEKKDILWITKVTDPTITIYLPASEKATGTAVVICPGGGYGGLAYDYEGIEIASFFNSIGVAGIVLKYRLPSDLIMQDKNIGPLQDAQEAVRIVRRNAKKWNINPNKIGMMGFSAGGHLASTASTHYNLKVYEPVDTTSARPDFSVLIYPVITMNKEFTHNGSRENLLGKNPGQTLVDNFSNELQVTKDTPPAFLAHALDDASVPVQNSINYVLALKKHGVSGELHIYEKGGHGFAIRNAKGTEAGWPEALKNWLKVKGWL
jgi:acetyl esterase/lipase